MEEGMEQSGIGVHTRISRQALREKVINLLAEVRAVAPDELLEESRTSGKSIVLESPEAEAIIGSLEHELGDDLVKSEDLRPEHLGDLESFVDLILRRIRERTSSARREV